MKILGIGNAIVDVICKVDENFLIKNNVDPNRLYVIGFGESRPASDNDSPKSKTENRHVKIKLIN